MLIKKYDDGSISRSEYIELVDELKAGGNERAFFNAIDAIWEDTRPVSFHNQAQEDAFYDKLIHSDRFKRKPFILRSKPFYRYAAAAVILLFLSAGLYFYLNHTRGSRFAANDIAPGSNKAMLLLSDGQKIDLTNVASGELLSKSGIEISKTADGKLLYSIKSDANAQEPGLENTIVTPKGGQYQVNLPDGTKVWLNAASTLKFPLQFNKNERSVSLTGEAYFEVAKKYKNDHRARLPFYVSTPKARVEVLGTHFNINAYEATSKTTLLEGSVRIVAAPNAKNSRQRISYLLPGEQAIVNPLDIVVSKADIEETLAWKNGFFVFNGQNLDRIMKDVERWYNVEVVFEDEVLKKESFNGTTSRFKNISQLLEVLESTGSVHFKIEGRRVKVMD
ncbi:FecR family protein [Pedobacter sp. 22226]|uniref:FecR family protein n=1 Tax=Pedobacter sp. 22226 TaxID=3453894 RepID=UPI003F87124D